MKSRADRGCPDCGNPEAWTKCYAPGCGWVYDGDEGCTTDSTPEARERAVTKIKDTRSENERKRDAVDAVEAIGWMIVDTEQGYRADGSTRVMKGFPDWLCMGFGRVAFIEWKTDTNQQTDDQKAFEEHCHLRGIPYAVCRNTRSAVDFLNSLSTLGGAA